MKLGIMQPYFFPYIGYFQLINAVDEFIIYDNIQYTKKGWTNRNRILVNGKPAYITLPLKSDSDYLHICDRHLSDSWKHERVHLLNQIKNAYCKAPFFPEIYTLIEKCIMFPDGNLFMFIYNSLVQIKQYLEIVTSINVSSSIEIDHNLKAADKVIALCKARNANVYINPFGAFQTGYYTKEIFKKEGIDIYFSHVDLIRYKQFEYDFVPNLSIIDIIMFNSKDKVQQLLNCYTLV